MLCRLDKTRTKIYSSCNAPLTPHSRARRLPGRCQGFARTTALTIMVGRLQAVKLQFSDTSFLGDVLEIRRTTRYNPNFTIRRTHAVYSSYGRRVCLKGNMTRDCVCLQSLMQDVRHEMGRICYSHTTGRDDGWTRQNTPLTRNVRARFYIRVRVAFLIAVVWIPRG